MIYRCIQILYKEKEKFKAELKSLFSFHLINPTHSQDRLKKRLDEKRLRELDNYEATMVGQLGSEYEELIQETRKELEIFADEKINEIMEKSEGICVFLAIIVCNVSVCVVSIELLFGVHIIFFSDLCTF